MAIRKDKMQSVVAGNIESVVLAADTQNGQVVTLGSPVVGERELVNGVAPTDVVTQEIVIISSPEIVYEAGKGILDFVNKAGKPARADHFTVGDNVTVTDDVIDGTSVVDKFLIPVNGKTKLAHANDLTGGTRFAAVVIGKGKVYGQPATTFRVVQA
ncbi:hypothetical protein GRF59_15180 [Paenibacillus sp. HJL G12]|uniref:DUF2190 family protein n=1 Tax=Paenibacillus dendrobii TaxID=2691084 RepID=A0A7X3IJ88_9BACL|nr:hypothetical protein [Paenibacillus dendrobii]MWV44964.1 hypothetical protein [Paenibacillus dendrobii]